MDLGPNQALKQRISELQTAAIAIQFTVRAGDWQKLQGTLSVN